MSFEVLSWGLAVLAIIGVVLNIQKNSFCFVIWLATNFAWAIIDFRAGLPAQGALFVVYTILAAWGLWKWMAEENEFSPCSLPCDDPSVRVCIRCYRAFKKWARADFPNYFCPKCFNKIHRPRPPISPPKRDCHGSAGASQ